MEPHSFKRSFLFLSFFLQCPPGSSSLSQIRSLLGENPCMFGNVMHHTFFFFLSFFLFPLSFSFFLAKIFLVCFFLMQTKEEFVAALSTPSRARKKNKTSNEGNKTPSQLEPRRAPKHVSDITRGSPWHRINNITKRKITKKSLQLRLFHFFSCFVPEVE